MPSKKFDLGEIGEIIVVKRRGNRNIRLSFDSSGQPRVSIPYHAPYRIGLTFAKSRQDWITRHRPLAPPLMDGQFITKRYQLKFNPGATTKSVSSRVRENKILVNYPSSLAAADDKVQAAARRGIIRAVKLEANDVLPVRIAELAKIYGYRYKLIKIKPMKRRWGSCDAYGNITLNSFLVTLAPELIDYVLVHELVHTRHQHHQAAFWQTMEDHLPNAKHLRKEARAAQPSL